jgi:hypothetical protein
LRLIRAYLLIKREGCTSDGHQDGMDNLLKRIKKQMILIRPDRHFTRRVKAGKYRKYK